MAQAQDKSSPMRTYPSPLKRKLHDSEEFNDAYVDFSERSASALPLFEITGSFIKRNLIVDKPTHGKCTRAIGIVVGTDYTTLFINLTRREKHVSILKCLHDSLDQRGLEIYSHNYAVISDCINNIQTTPSCAERWLPKNYLTLLQCDRFLNSRIDDCVVIDTTFWQDTPYKFITHGQWLLACIDIRLKTDSSLQLGMRTMLYVIQWLARVIPGDVDKFKLYIVSSDRSLDH